MGISVPFSFAFSFSSFLSCVSSDNHFAFLHFFLGGWSWSLPPIWCHKPPSICLSNLIPWIYLSLLLVAQTVKHLSTMQETRVRSLSWEDPLEKEMAIHSRTIAWKIPWTEEPGRLQSMGSQRVRHDWATSLSFFSLLYNHKRFDLGHTWMVWFSLSSI